LAKGRDRVQFRLLSLPRDLARWLEETAATSGISQGQLVREPLEKAEASGSRKPFMRFAGVVRGAADLSSRKGFSKP
jgi:hypothetical protein